MEMNENLRDLVLLSIESLSSKTKEELMTPMDRELFNLDMLILNKNNTQTMGEVKSLQIFEANSSMFHPHGLFSVDIFGPIGSKSRNRIPGYIDLKIPILLPLVYKTLTTMNGLYDKIMSGTSKARFDTDVNDFVLDEEKGETGYNFFLKHIDKIKYSNNSNSEGRNFKIRFLNKYGVPNAFIDKFIVIPAGIRDYTVDEKNQPSEDEINKIYRKILNTTTLLANTKLVNTDLAAIDTIRYRLQKLVVEVYEYIENLLNDKGGFIQNNWSSRSIAYGTRNVITATPTTVTDLNKSDNFVDKTGVGIHQYVSAIAPIAMNKIHTMFINRVMNNDTELSNLINKKTLKTEFVNVPPKIRQRWLTQDGLNEIFHKLNQDAIKEDFVDINGYWLCMVYDNGDNVYVIFDTENLPDGVKVEDLRPITYVEMLYISILDCVDKYPAFVTRYPVIEQGSIYPTKLYVKTTINGRHVKVHINSFVLDAVEYPILGEAFMKTVSLPYSRLPALGADSFLPCVI